MESIQEKAGVISPAFLFPSIANEAEANLIIS